MKFINVIKKDVNLKKAKVYNVRKLLIVRITLSNVDLIDTFIITIIIYNINVIMISVVAGGLRTVSKVEKEARETGDLKKNRDNPDYLEESGRPENTWCHSDITKKIHQLK